MISLIYRYGITGLFISLFLEFLGLPFPGETLMSFFGFISFKNGGYFVLFSIIASFAGTFLGATVAYLIGARFGEKLLLKVGKNIHITEESLTRTKQLFNNRKRSLLLFGRYILGIRHVVPYFAGIERMDFMEFSLYNLISSLLWSASFVLIGYFFGEQWKTIESNIRLGLLILLLLGLIAYSIYKCFKRHELSEKIR